MPRALMIFNPNAGRFAPEPVVQIAAECLRANGWDLQVEATRDAAHVSELAAQAADNGLDALIVGGGDGSLGLTIPGLAGSRTALGILPTGTANVMARQLGLPMITSKDPQTIKKIADLLTASTSQAIDIGTCNGQPFLLWAGLGFDAMIVDQSEHHRAHWKKRFAVPEYFFRALWTAHTWPGLDCEIKGVRADGRTTVSFKGVAQIAVATNVRLYAGGLVELSEQAVLDDSEMELWLFKGQGSRRVLQHAWNLYRGFHVHDPDVVQLRFTKAVLKSSRSFRIHTDGDPQPPVAEAELSIRKKGLELLVPPTAPRRLFTQ